MSGTKHVSFLSRPSVTKKKRFIAASLCQRRLLQRRFVFDGSDDRFGRRRRRRLDAETSETARRRKVGRRLNDVDVDGRRRRRRRVFS